MADEMHPLARRTANRTESNRKPIPLRNGEPRQSETCTLKAFAGATGKTGFQRLFKGLGGSSVISCARPSNRVR